MIYGSNDELRSYEQYGDSSIYANGIAGRVAEMKHLMQKCCNQMDDHIRKAKGIATNHPVAMTYGTFPLNLNEGNCRNKHPYYIKDIEAYAAYFPTCSIWRHIT